MKIIIKWVKYNSIVLYFLLLLMGLLYSFNLIPTELSSLVSIHEMKKEKELLHEEIQLTDSKKLTLQFLSLDGNGDIKDPYVIHIIDNGTTIQTVEAGGEAYLDPYPPIGENMKCVAKDFNFDGYMDFKVYSGVGFYRDLYYIYKYFLWNPETNIYELWDSSDNYINDDSYFDVDKKEILSYSDGGGYLIHISANWYKWSGKVTVPIGRIELDNTPEGGYDETKEQEIINHIATYKRINGEIQPVDTYDQPDFEQDRTLLQTQKIPSPTQDDLELRFYGYAPDVNHAGVSEVEIYSHGKQIQSIAEGLQEGGCFLDVMKSAKPLSVPQERVVQMQDYNFDGCMDFGIVVWTHGTIGSIGYIYFLWNPEKHIFEQYQNQRGYLNQNTVYNTDKKQIETEILDEDSLEATRKCVCTWVDGELKETEDDQ